MEKEELLEMMKDNGEDGKEYERITLLKGDNLAACVAFMLGIVFILLKLFVRRKFDYGVCAVVFIAVCIQNISEGLKLGKRWLILAGIIEGVVSLAMIILFLGEVFG